jgi:hypothetical protein
MTKVKGRVRTLPLRTKQRPTGKSSFLLRSSCDGHARPPCKMRRVFRADIFGDERGSVLPASSGLTASLHCDSSGALTVRA